MQRVKQYSTPVYITATSSYEIHVKTGDISKAGTDAIVYLVMYGSKGQTGELILRESKTNKNKFERGKTDIFDIEASNIGQVGLQINLLYSTLW